MLNITISQFIRNHKNKKNQILFHALKSNGIKETKNLINNFLNEKNSFIFESVEKGKIKGRYTILGRNPDYIWEFNRDICKQIKNNKTKILKSSPKKIVDHIIENFKFKMPKDLPNISSIISGYFSYDIIRYIEKIPNQCKDDLRIPDIRLIRPKSLIILDNIEKKIFFIRNFFKEEKVKNYFNAYNNVKADIENLILLANCDNYFERNNKTIKSKVSSNISKKKYLNNVIKAQKYIKKGDIFQVVQSTKQNYTRINNLKN